MSDPTDLLFFDTFSHESSEVRRELNLDLVQFPKPVYVTEIRIIPLGARVQADFPGGVRLGATNPSQFRIDFFVNDLSKPGASTFETLGSLEYCQNGTIHMECLLEQVRRMPTDGLVLKGWYTTVTLAVYGSLTKNLNDTPTESPQQNIQRTVPRDPPASAIPTISQQTTQDWNPELVTAYNAVASTPQEVFVQPPYNDEYENTVYRADFYDEDAPKDPRSYHHVVEGEVSQWDKPRRELSREASPVRDADRPRRSAERDRERRRHRSRSTGDRERSRESSRPRARSRDDRRRSRSHSRERYRALSRDREYRSPSRSPGYREEDWDRGAYKRDYTRAPYERTQYERRAPSYEKQLPYERHIAFEKRPSPYDRIRGSSYDGRSPGNEDPRKKPRTPPMDGRRPHTPHEGDVPRVREVLSPVDSITSDDYSRLSHKEITRLKSYKHSPSPSVDKSSQKSNYVESQHSGLLTVKVEVSPSQKIAGSIESPNQQQDDLSMDAEQFEPILSDEDICDDAETFVEMDFDTNEYCSAEDIIKCYNPFKSTWISYEPIHKTYLHLSNILKMPFSELCSRNATLSSIYNLIKPYSQRDDVSERFKECNSATKEEWVNTCEQLINLLMQLNGESEVIVRIFNEEKNGAEVFNDILKVIVAFCRIGLDFECAVAQSQPTYKIRHMKCGIRFVEALTAHRNSGIVISRLLSYNIDLCVCLINMYSKDYMALSIRLMILKSLDSCLSSKEAVEHFLTEHFDGKNGYQILISLLRKNPLSRIKFSLNSLLKKLNTYELLKTLHETVADLSLQSDRYIENHEIPESSIELIVNSLDELWSVYRNGAFDISQPKRFLPVSAQFEINKEGNSRSVLFDFFQTHKFLETCVFLLSFPETYNNNLINCHIYDLINDILDSHEGLKYLALNMEVSEVLFKCLMQPINDESFMFVQDLSSYTEIQLLGLEMAYRLKVKYYVDSIVDLSNVTDQEFELVEKLQWLYSLTFNSVGRLAVASVLSMADNIQCLLDIFDKDPYTRRDGKSDSTNKYKTPAKSYAVDLTVSTLKFSSDVSFLTKYGKRMLNIAKKFDNFDQSISVYLQEIVPYLKPLEKPNILTCDNIGDIIEIIKASLDRVTTLPGEIVTCLRILAYFSIAQYEREPSPLPEQISVNYIELKYKYNILQLFSNDGVTHLVTILEKLTNHYDQPFLHTHTFVSIYGLNLAHVILLCLQLLNKMLSYVIQYRNIQFKDTTAIPIILQTYSLLRAYPSNALGYRTAQKACNIAIDTLLAYTQPISEDASETEAISKTLWTLMCGEIIKYILTAPYTFVPGLLIFSELLPLPLPIPTKLPLHASEISKIMNNRKLWSAHLHTLSNSLTEMIQTMCISAYQPVTQMLKRVCVQIADLASNMAQTVVRSVIDLILKDLCDENGALQEPLLPCSHKMARLFSFLACLMAHASVKCTVLHLIRQTTTLLKSEERYWLIIPILCAVMKTHSDVTSHVQTQECAASIINSLCDSEITLLSQMDPSFVVKSELKTDEFVVNSDVYLANALPPKDALLKIINSTFDYLSSDGMSLTVISSILRTYFMVTEHDFGFYYFKNCLDKNKSVFVRLFNKVVNDVNKDSAECLSILLELLRLLQSPPEELDAPEVLQFSPRTCCISGFDVSELIGFTKDEEHPILTLEKFLKEKNADEDLIANTVYLATAVQKAANAEENNPCPSVEEQSLPAAETLAMQFTNRAVCTQGDSHDDRLSLSYWLNMPNLAAPPHNEDDVADNDSVTCDIMEIANKELGSSGGAQSLLVALNDLLHTTSAGAGTLSGLGDSQDPKFRLQSSNLRDRRPFVSPARGGAEAGGGSGAADGFRSRPPNTSRPPSLHVDDFVALEGRGAQPTGPTGYNKLTAAAVAARGRNLRTRGMPVPDRGRFASSVPQQASHYRNMRGRGAWGANEMANSSHFAHFSQGSQYGSGSWNHMSRGRGHRGLRHMRNSFMR